MSGAVDPDRRLVVAVRYGNRSRSAWPTLARGALAAMIATAAGPQAFAQAEETASATVVATADILAPISLAHNGNASLSFGTIVVGGIGTVSVDVAGGHDTTGDVALIGTRLPTRDSFSVTGEAGRSFAITTTNGSLGSIGGMTYTT